MTATRPLRTEGSVNVSLKDLLRMEEDRVREVQEGERRRADAERRQREETERQARDAQLAREREEEARRLEAERRHREEAARIDAMKMAIVEQARGAARAAELEELRRHDQANARAAGLALAQSWRVRALVVCVLAGAALICTVAAYFIVIAPADARARADLEGKLAERSRALEETQRKLDASDRALSAKDRELLDARASEARLKAQLDAQHAVSPTAIPPRGGPPAPHPPHVNPRVDPLFKSCTNPSDPLCGKI